MTWNIDRLCAGLPLLRVADEEAIHQVEQLPVVLAEPHAADFARRSIDAARNPGARNVGDTALPE